MKKKRYLLLLSAVLMAAVVSILVICKKVKITPIFANRFEVTGVDVSHYQGTIDWKKLAEQDLDFAFIKATEGSSYIDECFYDNWKEAEKTDLCIGAYHFFSFPALPAKPTPGGLPPPRPLPYIKPAAQTAPWT